jgi:hypothetical protein
VTEPRSPGGAHALVEVLLTIGRLQRTGILTVQGNQQIIGLTFLEGEIISTDALNESLEDGLGSVLASRHLVSAEDFASMVAEYEAGGGRVTDLLIERNYIDRQQLMEALEWHNYLLCREVLSWEESEYKFYEGSEVAHEEGMRPLPVEELLVLAAEDLGSDGPLPGTMPDADAIYRKTELDDMEAGRNELLISLATGDTEGASGLMQMIDGLRTVAELADNVGLSQYEARLTMYLLEQAGRVEFSVDETAESLPGAGRKAAAKVAGAGASVAKVGAKWLERNISPGQLRVPSVSEIDWLAWPARILALGAFILLVALTWSDPVRFLQPFPWQQGLRQAVLDEQTSAAYLKVDRAAKTSFLLDGHFPEALEKLVGDAYLTPRDLVDPVGRRLGYSSQVAGYLIFPEGEEDVTPGASRTEAVTGNFLLDPEFLQDRTVEIPPLVLLD